MKRSTARVIMFNEHGHVLLFRERDSTTADLETWWITPGGGLEPGETPSEAALREVREETGVTLETVRGPIYEQERDFTFEGVQLHQYEQFFVAHVTEFVIDTHGWTDLEKRSTLESRWWSLEELESTTDTVHPRVLAKLVRTELSLTKTSRSTRE